VRLLEEVLLLRKKVLRVVKQKSD
jgi:hypothetical protein